jgi:hypothetical protein
MLDVLQARGGLFIARTGWYGGKPGGLGSGHLGRRITQSTTPVSLGDGNFVVLRHPLSVSNEPGAVELIKTPSSGPGYCVIEPELSGDLKADSLMAEYIRQRDLKFTEDDVIAGYLVRGRDEDHRDYAPDYQIAVAALVDHIETSLAPLDPAWTRITNKLPCIPVVDSGLPLREGSNELSALVPTQITI